MRRSNLIGLLLGGLLAACQSSSTGSGAGGTPAGGGPSSPPSVAPPAPVPPPSANLSVFDTSGAAGPFQLQQLDRLVLALTASHLRPGPHELRVAITSPNGALYAQFPAKVVVGDDGAARSSSNLQVRGSTIELYSQTGSWQVLATVDGTPMAVASIDLTE